MWLLLRGGLNEAAYTGSFAADARRLLSLSGGLFFATAGLSAAAFGLSLALSPDLAGAFTGVMLDALILCAAFDLSYMRVPNAITYGGTGLVLIAATIAGDGALLSALGGALVAGGFLLAMSLLSRGKVGLGDAKLSAFGGALIGIDYAIPALFAGTLGAAVIYLTLLATRRIRRNDPLPYAPFLAFGFVVIAFASGSVFTV
jgi:prepilin signal peptidase PulO-like enzyme (type II secretory pathway)